MPKSSLAQNKGKKKITNEEKIIKNYKEARRTIVEKLDKNAQNIKPSSSFGDSFGKRIEVQQNHAYHAFNKDFHENSYHRHFKQKKKLNKNKQTKY